jgi:hypothetical protein
MSEDTTKAPPRDGGAKPIEDCTFDERQVRLAEMTDDARQKLFEATPLETREKWAKEEQAHLEELVKDQPVEGAEFAGEANEEVRIDGQTEGEQPAPNAAADAELIATLVRERIEAEGRANSAERKLEEANAEVNAYYERFGPLGS